MAWCLQGNNDRTDTLLPMNHPALPLFPGFAHHQIEVAKGLQRRLSELRRGCYLDTSAAAFVKSESLAEDLRQLIPQVNQVLSRDQSSSLMDITDD